MYEQATVAVVVPAYNEESFVGDVIDSVPEFVDRLYVIDDCSTDGTWEEILSRADGVSDERLTLQDSTGERLAVPRDGPVRVGQTDGGTVIAPRPESSSDFGRTVVPVRHSINRGRGGAVVTGYQLALTEGVDVVAVMDGDGQMDGEILERIVRPVAENEADYAKGNRLVDSDHWGEMPDWRLFGNAVLTTLTKVASGYYHVRDPQNGFTAVSAETLADISLDAVYDDYGFLNDFLVRLSAHDKRVVDIPMRARYDDEESGIRYHRFVPLLSWLLLRMYVWRVWVSYGLGDPAASSGRSRELLSPDGE